MTSTILMADDDSAFALLVRHALRKARIPADLTVVHDGSEAIAYLAGEDSFADRVTYPHPGLLLLDLNMPHVGGIAVLEWLRARPAFRSLPVAVLTSSNAFDDIERCQRLGCSSYFIKPITLTALVEIIETACEMISDRSHHRKPPQASITPTSSFRGSEQNGA